MIRFLRILRILCVTEIEVLYQFEIFLFSHSIVSMEINSKTTSEAQVTYHSHTALLPTDTDIQEIQVIVKLGRNRCHRDKTRLGITSTWNSHNQEVHTEWNKKWSCVVNIWNTINPTRSVPFHLWSHLSCVSSAHCWKYVTLVKYQTCSKIISQICLDLKR